MNQTANVAPNVKHELHAALEHLRQLEETTETALECKLAKIDKKITHEIRQEWVATVVKSTAVALLSAGLAIEIIKTLRHIAKSKNT